MGNNKREYLPVVDDNRSPRSSDVSVLKGETAARLTFIMMGMATLVPWLSYISAVDFFMELFPGRGLQFVIAVVNTSVLLSGSIIMLYVSHMVDIRTRIIFSGWGLAVSMMFVPAVALCVIHSSSTVGLSDRTLSTLFVLTIAAQFVNAAFNAVLQSSVYGLAGELSRAGELTAAGQFGQGIAGVLVVAIRLMTKAAFPEDLVSQAWSTIIFFVTGGVVILVSLVLFALMLKTPLIASRMREKEKRHEAAGQQFEKIQSTEKSPIASVNSSSAENENGHDLAIDVKSVFGKVKEQALSACLVFTTCLACFPGLTSSLESTTLNLGSWFPIILIAVFNVADLVGKGLPQHVRAFKPQHTPFAAVAHMVFLPLFAWRLSDPGLGDVFPLVLVALLGGMSGYIGCCAMMYGPEAVSPKEREIAGIIDSFFLILGLALGSVVGLIIGQYCGGN